MRPYARDLGVSEHLGRILAALLLFGRYGKIIIHGCSIIHSSPTYVP